MSLQLPFLLLSILALSSSTVTGSSCNAALNTSNYTAFESMLLAEKNLIALENVFYPTNLHSSVLVDVYYHLESAEISGPATVSDLDKADTNLVQVQSLSKNKAEYHNLDSKIAELNEAKTDELFVIKFRWSASPINLYMRIGLLQRLSLMAHKATVIPVHIYLQAPCLVEEFNLIGASEIITSTCVIVNGSLLLNQLNHLTANVSYNLCTCIYVYVCQRHLANCIY